MTKERLRVAPHFEMNKNSWTDKLFKQQYLEAEGLQFSSTITAAECDLIVDMVRLEPGRAVLDLACGHGRHALELAKRGFGAVTGLDYSSEALEYAARDADARALTVDWVRGDMRSLELTERFDAVFNAYNSLFYWDDATHLGILRGIHRALRPNGLLWLDVYNRESLAAHCFLEEHPRWGLLIRLRRELFGLKKRVSNMLKAGEVTFVKSTQRQFDPRTGVLRGMKRIKFSDGREFADPFEIRLYSYTELSALLEQAGFEVLEARSCPDGGEYRLGSVRVALLARKI